MPPNPNNPLAAAFAAIDAQAAAARQRPQLVSQMTNVEAPVVGAAEQGLIAGLMPPESDLDRASALAKAAAQGGSGGAASPQNIIEYAAAHGNIGTSVPFTDNGYGIAALTPVLRIQGADGKAEVFTVALQSWQVPAAPIAPHPNPVRNSSLVCVVQYGAGGMQNQVEFDWVDGTVFSVPGSFVQVSVYARAVATGVMPPPVYTVGAFVVRQVGVRNSTLLDSMELTTVLHGGGASADIPIPANASAVQIFALNASTFTVNPDVQVLGIGGAGLYDQQLPPGTTLRLVGGATFVKVVNNDPAVDLAGYITFTIEL
jgi:hypothetical protein